MEQREYEGFSDGLWKKSKVFVRAGMEGMPNWGYFSTGIKI